MLPQDVGSEHGGEVRCVHLVVLRVLRDSVDKYDQTMENLLIGERQLIEELP